MKKQLSLIIFILVVLTSTAQIPQNAQILIDAYPSQNLRYDDNYIVFPDGTRIIYDDGQQKDFEYKLDNSDIEDMFSLKYDKSSLPDYLADAGRSRCDEFFKKMYGSSAQEAQKNFVKVPWFGQMLTFTKVNGADQQLMKVAEEIAKFPEFTKYMAQSSTFYWRKVRGANRQSSHSYAIAIDINVSLSNYWLWSNPKATETTQIEYKNRVPMQIVEIFEKHGFVWGGRWYHYDTMHFEYRPEIINFSNQ